VELTDQKIGFNGLRVGAFESRMQAEMTRLIENLGGKPFVAPSVREVPLEENHEAFAFWDQLKAGKIDVVILMTGVGTRTLVDTLSTKAPKDEILKTLSKTVLIVRGPKPAKVLSEWKIAPAWPSPTPGGTS
jgi:uroporphyrinogen-III synthase